MGSEMTEAEIYCKAPADSWLKRLLWAYRLTPPPSDYCQQNGSSVLWIQRLLVVGLVLLALTAMIMLLFWNYHCIFITRICQDQEGSSAYPYVEGPGDLRLKARP
ncbi:hypothetical protein DPEC_G00258510 [Dallia pectoralis]|uniref:Uncharacterized protein n=1 Tax=Dallia pectoralis TaxID=75939 RepID=A0ACC2FQT0_DALPE|nr:hypothetical protein DPEC_G00258510 [Dallia pectoralis]